MHAKYIRASSGPILVTVQIERRERRLAGQLCDENLLFCKFKTTEKFGFILTENTKLFRFADRGGAGQHE